MRTLLYILLFIPGFAFAQGRRILLPVGADSAIYQMDVAYKLKVQPGDSLIVPDKPIKSMKLSRFWGTAEKPIVITWQNPKQALGGYGAYAVSIQSAAFFKLENFYVHGKGNSNSGVAIGWDVHDFELSNGVIRNVFGAGVKVKTDPNQTDTLHSLWPQTIYNVTIKNVAVDTAGNEGFYIGNTGTSGLLAGQAPVALVNVTIDSCIAMHTQWDGIQFSHILGLKIGTLCVFDYGKANHPIQPYQRSGVEIGGSVTLAAPVKKITVARGTGSGLKVFGKGVMLFDSVTLTGTGMAEGESGMYVDDFPDPHYNVTAPQALTINSLTITGANKAPLYYANRLHTALPITVKQYAFTGAAVPYFDATKGVWGVIDTVVKKPVDTIVVNPVDTVIVIKPVDTLVVIVTDDTVRITGNYTVTKSGSIVKFTGATAAKLTLPATPTTGFTLVVQNAGKANLAFNKRVYFTNGKYRMMIKPKETLWIEWRADKKRLIITKRVY